MKKLTRRTLLASTAAAGAFAVADRAEALVFPRGGTTPGGGGGSNLTAEVTFPGGVPTASTVVFDQSLGTNLGDYVAPTAGFTQHCVRARNALVANFFVDFRPDASGGRVEVVFWNGETDPTGTTIPSAYVRNLPPYNVVIKQGGTTIATISQTQWHWWPTRWRWQSAPRSIIRTASQVFSDNFYPHMSTHAARSTGNNGSTGQAWSGLPYTNPAGNIIVPVTPFSVGTYTPFMPADGIVASTTLTANAIAGATTISVASPNVINEDGGGNVNICTIALDDGSVFATRGVSAFNTPNPITIESPLPFAASSGNAAHQVVTKLGLVLYVENGGERNELGPMSEWAADYLLNGTASSLNAIIQQSEMVASEWPFYFPDVQTTTALQFKRNLATYKMFIGTPAYGGYYQASNDATGTNSGLTIYGNGWDFHEGDSHFQMHGYITYALTEDPYYLEFCQYMCSYGVGSRGTMLGREGNQAATHGQFGWGDLLGTPNGSGGINGLYTNCSYYGEIRTVGNGVRNLAMNYKIAPASGPSWLQPQSYLSAIAQDYAAVIDQLWATGATNNVNTKFFQLSSDPFFQIFEQSYGILGMCIAVANSMPGTPSWLTILNYFFGMHDNILNGTSGWNNQTPQPHDIFTTVGGGVCAGGPNIDITAVTTWGAFYACVATWMKTAATFPSAPAPGNQQGGSMGNCSMVYAACAAAKSVGATAAPAAMAYISNFIDYNYPNNADASMGIHFEWKCGFDGT